MTGIVSGLPVVLALLVAALLPLAALPSSVAEAFSEGGWGMRLILFAFLVSLWLVVDRLLMVLRSVTSGHRLLEQLRPRLENGDLAGARAICAAVDRPLARIIGAGLAATGGGEQSVRAEMDAAAYRELPAIERRTGYLALMGNVATLMGLFGTIIGLIHSFGAVSMSSGAENATRLAAGISEAMNCTAFGLLTGILALVAYSALTGRTQALSDEIHLRSLQAFRLWKRGLAAARGQARAGAAERGPIRAPGGQLMQSTGLLKGKRHGHGKKSTFASLQLTPLIDMFIVLVIFLLLSFSASGEIVTASKDIKPPFAKNVQELQRVPIVSISNMPDHPSKGIVTLEDREVALVSELTDESGGDWRIAQLSAQLERLRNAWSLRHADEPFDGKLIVQCDQDIDFRVIKRVMYSAGVAGYGNLMFAVRKKAEALAP